MAYEELLEFAGGRSQWQQDALRRLALYGELTGDDFEELQLQIEQAVGFPAEGVPDPVPLAVEHLSHAASNDPKTVLASLGPRSPCRPAVFRPAATSLCGQRCHHRLWRQRFWEEWLLPDRKAVVPVPDPG